MIGSTWIERRASRRDGQGFPRLMWAGSRASVSN